MKTWKNRTEDIRFSRKLQALLFKCGVALKRLLIITCILTIIWVVVSGQLLVSYNKFCTSIHGLLVDVGLELNHVYLSGQKYIDTESVVRLALPYQNQSIFGFSLRNIKNKIEDLAWVESCSVTRHLPNTLYINIVERTPIAIWQYHHDLYLIDNRGYVFSSDNIERFSHLIITVGEGGATHIRSLLTTLDSYPSIRDNVSSAVRISDRRWNLITIDDTVIKLPEENIDHALQVLHSMVSEDVIDDKIKIIDLRDRSKVYTR